MVTILFACTHNAGRSQMASTFFNSMANPEKALAISAGTEPADHVHPEVISVMREAGFDLESVIPQQLTGDLASSASLLVTMGCGESCPIVPGLRHEDWALTDPKGLSLERVRGIRDDIRDRVQRLVKVERWE